MPDYQPYVPGQTLPPGARVMPGPGGQPVIVMPPGKPQTPPPPGQPSPPPSPPPSVTIPPIPPSTVSKPEPEAPKAPAKPPAPAGAAPAETTKSKTPGAERKVTTESEEAERARASAGAVPTAKPDIMTLLKKGEKAEEALSEEEKEKGKTTKTIYLSEEDWEELVREAKKAGVKPDDMTLFEIDPEMRKYMTSALKARLPKSKWVTKEFAREFFNDAEWFGGPTPEQAKKFYRQIEGVKLGRWGTKKEAQEWGAKMLSGTMVAAAVSGAARWGKSAGDGADLIGGLQLTEEEREFTPDPSWKVAEKNAKGNVTAYVDDEGIKWYTPESLQYKYYGVWNSLERVQVTRQEYVDPKTGQVYVRFEGGTGRRDNPRENPRFYTVITESGERIITPLEYQQLMQIDNFDEFQGQIRNLVDAKEGRPVLPLNRNLAGRIGTINLFQLVMAGIDKPEDYQAAGYNISADDIQKVKEQVAGFKRQLSEMPLYVQQEYQKAVEEGGDEFQALNRAIKDYNEFSGRWQESQRASFKKWENSPEIVALKESDPYIYNILVTQGQDAAQKVLDKRAEDISAIQERALEKLSDYAVPGALLTSVADKRSPAGYSLMRYGQMAYDVDAYIRDNPTPEAVRVLKAAGFKDDVIQAAEGYIDGTKNSRIEIVAKLKEGEKVLDATVSSLERAYVDAGIDFPEEPDYWKPQIQVDGSILWKDERTGELVSTKDKLRYLWEHTPETDQVKVAGYYGADKYKSNYFASYHRSLERVAAEGGVVGGIIFGPILPITSPIAKKLTGQPVTAIEWITAGAVAVLNSSLMGVPIRGAGQFLLASASAFLGGMGTYETIKNWGDLSKPEKAVSIIFNTALLLLPAAMAGKGVLKGGKFLIEKINVSRKATVVDKVLEGNRDGFIKNVTDDKTVLKAYDEFVDDARRYGEAQLELEQAKYIIDEIKTPNTRASNALLNRAKNTIVQLEKEISKLEGSLKKSGEKYVEALKKSLDIKDQAALAEIEQMTEKAISSMKSAANTIVKPRSINRIKASLEVAKQELANLEGSGNTKAIISATDYVNALNRELYMSRLAKLNEAYIMALKGDARAANIVDKMSDKTALKRAIEKIQSAQRKIAEINKDKLEIPDTSRAVRKVKIDEIAAMKIDEFAARLERDTRILKKFKEVYEKTASEYSTADIAKLKSLWRETIGIRGGIEKWTGKQNIELRLQEIRNYLKNEYSRIAAEIETKLNMNLEALSRKRMTNRLIEMWREITGQPKRAAEWDTAAARRQRIKEIAEYFRKEYRNLEMREEIRPLREGEEISKEAGWPAEAGERGKVGVMEKPIEAEAKTGRGPRAKTEGGIKTKTGTAKGTMKEIPPGTERETLKPGLRPEIEPKSEEKPEVVPETETKTRTEITTKPKTKPEAESKTEIQIKAVPEAEAEPEQKTESKAMPAPQIKTEAEVKPETKPAPKIEPKPKTMLEPKVEPKLKTEPEPKVEPETETKTKTETETDTTTKKKRRIKPSGPGSEEKEWTPEEVKSAIAWKDGFVVHAVKAPYRRGIDERSFNINKLPAGLEVLETYQGKGSQQRSAKVTGQLPARLTVDVGNQDVTITPDKRTGRVRMEHRHDTIGTTSMTTISRRRNSGFRFTQPEGVISRPTQRKAGRRRRRRIIY